MTYVTSPPRSSNQTASLFSTYSTVKEQQFSPVAIPPIDDVIGGVWCIGRLFFVGKLEW